MAILSQDDTTAGRDDYGVYGDVYDRLKAADPKSEESDPLLGGPTIYNFIGTVEKLGVWG
jgi:hypothetical protein